MDTTGYLDTTVLQGPFWLNHCPYMDRAVDSPLDPLRTASWDCAGKNSDWLQTRQPVWYLEHSQSGRYWIMKGPNNNIYVNIEL